MYYSTEEKIDNGINAKFPQKNGPSHWAIAVIFFTAEEAGCTIVYSDINKLRSVDTVCSAIYTDQ